MKPSGMWKGRLNGTIGYFNYMNVEVLADQKGKVIKKPDRNTRRACPETVEELLARIGLKEYHSVFNLNG
jgi:hypothetical protein